MGKLITCRSLLYSMDTLVPLLVLFVGVRGTLVQDQCTEDYVDDACLFWKCDTSRTPHAAIRMPPCKQGMVYSKRWMNCVMELSAYDDCSVNREIIAEPFCKDDKLDENCVFFKCVNEQYYVQMPGCLRGYSHGKSSFVCLKATDPDACIPQNGLVTDKIITDQRPCDPNPCLNGGRCIESQSAYICACRNTHMGSNCETEIQANKCNSAPCQNGGICVDTNSGYICNCQANVNGFTYRGPNCELQSQSLTNPCTNNPCQNGGFCQQTNSGFSCSCSIGYSGQRCELVSQNLATACDSGTCKNRGTCFSTPFGIGYFCVCGLSQDGTKTYKGINCEIEMPTLRACDSSPCLFNGTCTETSSSPYYHCQCVQTSNGKTYGGPRCETELTSSGITDQCQNSITAKMADPEECQKFYDCSLVYTIIPINFKQHLDECPYPQLFNDITKQCDDFTNVDCGVRKVSVDGCDYSKNKATSGHTVPCTFLYPSCKNKPDGKYEHPGKPMSPDYITCFKERMLGISTCEVDSNGETQIFYNGVCTNVCVKDGDGYHADSSNARRYIKCANGILSVYDCGPSMVFNDDYNSCMFVG